MKQWILWVPGLVWAVMGDIGNFLVDAIEGILGFLGSVLGWLIMAIVKVIEWIITVGLAVLMVAIGAALGSIKWTLIGLFVIWFFYELLFGNKVDFNWFSMVAQVLFGIQFVINFFYLGWIALKAAEQSRNRYSRRW